MRRFSAKLLNIVDVKTPIIILVILTNMFRKRQSLLQKTVSIWWMRWFLHFYEGPLTKSRIYSAKDPEACWQALTQVALKQPTTSLWKHWHDTRETYKWTHWWIFFYRKTSLVFPKLKQMYGSEWGWQWWDEDTRKWPPKIHWQWICMGKGFINSLMQEQVGTLLKTEIWRIHNGVERNKGKLKIDT